MRKSILAIIAAAALGLTAPSAGAMPGCAPGWEPGAYGICHPKGRPFDRPNPRAAYGYHINHCSPRRRVRVCS
jgi:hypothetical protein